MISPVSVCSKPLFQTLLGQKWCEILVYFNHQTLPSDTAFHYHGYWKCKRVHIHPTSNSREGNHLLVQMSNKINNHFIKKGEEKQELTPFTSHRSFLPCLVYKKIHVTISSLMVFYAFCISPIVYGSIFKNQATWLLQISWKWISILCFFLQIDF